MIAGFAPLDGAVAQTTRVLVVDDEEDQFVLVRWLLAPFTAPSFDVEWADSYRSGLAAVTQGGYDVCLVDYRLGLMDGVEFIKEATSLNADFAFVLVTGQGDRDVDMEAMAAGAVDYLSKSTLDGPTLERAIRYARTQHALIGKIARGRDLAEAFEDVNRVLSTDGPTRAALQGVLDVIESRLGYTRSAIYLVAGDLLTLGAARGFAAPIASLPTSSGPVGRVVTDGRASIIPSWIEPGGSSESPGCQFMVPMQFETRVLALLTVAVTDRQPADDADQAALMEIASRVAVALGVHQERTSLAERRLMLRRATEFTESALRGHDDAHDDRLLGLIRDAFPADGYAFAALQPDQTLVVQAAVGTLEGRVGHSLGQRHSEADRARTRRQVQVDSTGTSCAAFAPILCGDDLLGLLWVERRRLDRPFSPVETDGLGLLGHQMGTLLQLERDRAVALSSGVRDVEANLYTRAFLEALLAFHGAEVGTIGGPTGLVIAGLRVQDQGTVDDERRTFDALARVASDHVAGGPDIVARYGATTVAILVRDSASERTTKVAHALADVSGAPGMLAIASGWAIRSPDEGHSLMPAAEMAFELSRRTRAVVQG